MNILLEVSLDLEAQLELKAFLELQDSLGRRVREEIQASQGLVELRVLLDILVFQVYRDLGDPLDPLVLDVQANLEDLE